MTHITKSDNEVIKTASVALNFLLNKLTKSDEFSFLDIGCGNGCDINFISSNLDNLILYGIDVSLEAIEKAIQLNSNKKNITFECMRWKDLEHTQYDII